MQSRKDAVDEKRLTSRSCSSKGTCVAVFLERALQPSEGIRPIKKGIREISPEAMHDAAKKTQKIISFRLLRGGHALSRGDLVAKDVRRIPRGYCVMNLTHYRPDGHISPLLKVWKRKN
mgnify:CR=1 FL=1